MTDQTPAPCGGAPYAADPRAGRGRRISENPSSVRTDFQRDRDRIIHSSAFRRLALKTQVFLPDEGDHFRTRLTHTIEVAQIARTITRALGLDDDLGEALALAHDLGHTPFGHTGEDALDESLAAFGGFDHNAQTLRIVVLLERRYPGFNGLNLTWDTLDGLLKRGGPIGDIQGRQASWHRHGLLCFAVDDEWTRAFDRAPYPSAEAQAAAVADDIAYNAHDIEDGLQAGLFTLDDVDEVALLERVKTSVVLSHPGISDDLIVRGLTRELVGVFVEDTIAESRKRLAEAKPDSPEAIRVLDHPVVSLSPAMTAASDAIKAFLYARMYRHPRLVNVRSRAKQIVRDLAGKLLSEPWQLPPEWRPLEGSNPQTETEHARRVADYVAGMTDRYATAEHRRLFDATPELR
jgi:dGTPase